ncbi:transposase (plasmid) [Enterobacter bugandensis]|uniref:IS110 family transposase n=1 Tax=Enterobacter bugandensis TaxID=881260 RepID=UPI00283A920C|nr:transposase [Enterobacter bugandensis]WMU75440.1 transposase [Enterobacter bugandensis]
MFQLGIDVSKKMLDLCLLREGVKGRVKTRRIKNDVNAASTVITWLGKQQCAPGDVHIIMEATGIYHESLAYGLYRAGAKVSLANPHRSREFARGMDILTKNDQVDAYMLACYGALKVPEPWVPPPESVRYLCALLHRRDALVTDRSREKNRLEKCRATDIPPAIAESIKNVLRNLSAEIEHLDELILTHLDQHPELKKDFDLLTSIRGSTPESQKFPRYKDDNIRTSLYNNLRSLLVLLSNCCRDFIQKRPYNMISRLLPIS